MRVFLYIQSVSRDPNTCEQSVPLELDNNEVFFGPCKRHLRALLREECLGPGRREPKPREETYLVGLNGYNRSRIRKMIWVGRVKRVMTFGEAYRGLATHAAVRRVVPSPLHVRGLYRGGRFVGYEHVSGYHGKAWASDLTSRRRRATGRRLVAPATMDPSRFFDRDACLILENIFFAHGQGIRLDEEVMRVLSERQYPRKIDTWAVFGKRRNGTADGLTGRWLLIGGTLANRLVRLLKLRARRLNRDSREKGAMPRVRRSASKRACGPDC